MNDNKDMCYSYYVELIVDKTKDFKDLDVKENYLKMINDNTRSMIEHSHTYYDYVYDEDVEISVESVEVYNNIVSSYIEFDEEHIHQCVKFLVNIYSDKKIEDYDSFVHDIFYNIEDNYTLKLTYYNSEKSDNYYKKLDSQIYMINTEFYRKHLSMTKYDMFNKDIECESFHKSIVVEEDRYN